MIHPEGHLLLKAFRRDPFPTFIYEVDGAELEKTVFMAYGENTTVVEYEWKGEGNCTLEDHPLLAFRDYHSTILARLKRYLRRLVSSHPG